MDAHNPGKMLEIAGKAAQIILENGAETYRVEDTVIRLCRSFGYEDADVIALSTGVLISITVPGDSASIIRRVRKRSLNLARVNAVNDLSRRITQGGISMDEALASLKIIATGETLAPWLAILMSGLAAGSFTLMFGGDLLSCAIAALCGLVSQCLNYAFRKAEISLVLTSIVGGAICAAITMGAYYIFPMSAAAVENTIAGAIMPLISGLMMTNAVRDTLRGDLLSGMARGMEALLIAIMVALGVSLVLQLYLPGSRDTIAPPWYLAILFAGVATMFFCPLLKIPTRAILPASLLGAIAYGGYLLLMEAAGFGSILSLFLASAVVSVLCDLFARRMRMITTIFLCAALIPLVPGLGLYRTMRDLLLGVYQEALVSGLQTIFAIGAIALGAAVGSLRIYRPERLERIRKWKR